MIRILALLSIILFSCSQPEKDYYKQTKKVIHSVKAKTLKNGSVVCTLLFVGGGYAIVDGEKGSCLHKGDTINVVTFASDSSSGRF